MNYKILFSAAIILFAFLLTVGTAAADPIQINDQNDLMAINDPANLDKEYILMNDLDFTGITAFRPIGNNSYPFIGIFDGNGHTISNLTFSNPAMDYVGLFGYTEGASIYDLSLKNFNLEGQNYVGGFVGRANGTIINNCSVDNLDPVLISGQNYVGGFVGYLSLNSEISNSSATGKAEGNGDVGGFAGYLHNSIIFNSYATGDAVGNGNVGGFVGYLSTDSMISTSYAMGNAEGSNAGGFAGYLYNSSISNSYSMGNAEGSTAGGFAGYLHNSNIYNSYATGTADGTGTVGGFVGDMGGAAGSTITDSFYLDERYPNPGKGVLVTPEQLREINTFQVTGTIVSIDWSISSGPDPNVIWYILEGEDYPKFYWKSLSTTYTVTFDDDNGNTWDETVTIGTAVAQPADPVKADHTFVEWQLNDVTYDFNELVTGDLTLKAFYTANIVSHTVTFDDDNGNTWDETVTTGTAVAQPADPVKAGHTFVEWQLNDVTYDFNDLVTGDLTLKAFYTAVNSGGSGGGTGNATVVNNTSTQNSTPMPDNTTKDNTSQNDTTKDNTSQNDTKQNDTLPSEESPKLKRSISTILVWIIAIIFGGGYIYVCIFNKKNKDES
jgi:Listeria-Bacteroides repeat domain (List_Bact_rpt)./The GLUG motif.